MSFDLNLSTACNHEVYRELSLIDESLRIVRLDKPLAVASTLKLYAADNLVPAGMYTIIDDPQQIEVQRSKVIMFTRPWRSAQDYFETTYTTLPSFCAKCSGSNYLDDVQFDVRGGLQMLRDEKLLLQNVEKFIVTRINSNPFHLGIGTSLTGLIGTKITNITFLVSRITAEISKALQKLQGLQSQLRLTGRKMSAGETLQAVNEVKVTQNESDPTVMTALIAVTAASGKTVEYIQYLKIRS
jgi:hypothetical protein